MISVVNLIQAALLAVALLGLCLLSGKKQHQGFIGLLLLVVLLCVFNLLEETNLTRDLYLVTPVFVLGLGPAFYLAVKSAFTSRLEWQDALHFLPMLALLPLAQQQPQWVIAIGTVWRLGYALLTFRLVWQFNQLLRQQRSDAEELSFGWFAWVLAVQTLVSMLDLLRLNMQPALGQLLNQTGQGVSTAITLVLLAYLIVKLVKTPVDLASLSLVWQSEHSSDEQSLAVSGVEPSLIRSENAADYSGIFTELDQQIRQQQWYTQPRLSLEQLSELTGLNPRDISRAINLVAGLNFNDYINQLRVKQIQSQIQQQPDTSLLTLALNAGFNSKSSFNTSFRQWVGLTPSAYRQQQLNT
ncbi:helix-turn-helix domain-containing protein [Rheinheimera sp. 1928-s]|uniref:helix-turn-helix domain-containing protein n=1 Tax=Rheinheimera sp. 1928-s TaxID=3033803 RepID=UPI002634BAF7|nr:helix-turn-helix domain-containing protein [Rheinheimera sp. 1928-s]MDF3123660.1 helix-turn-helix domain-containing protein [Rheinheimera sp. 1928-s]